MAILPRPIYSDNIKKKGFIKFYGLNHTNGAGDGSIYDMENLSSDDFPLVSVRKPRRIFSTSIEDVTDFYSDGEHLFLICRNVAEYELWVDGKSVGKFGSYSSNITHSIATIGEKTVIAPEMVIYDNADGTLKSAAVSIEKIPCVFRDGTYAGEDAEACVIEYRGDDKDFDFGNYFNVGDGITIEGATDGANNKTIVLREISPTTLGFYEFSFLIPDNVENEDVSDPDSAEGGKGKGDGSTGSGTGDTGTGESGGGDDTDTGGGDTGSDAGGTDDGDNETDGDGDDGQTDEKPLKESEPQTLTISRTVPEIDFICENENRLWGCRGSSIYSSKVGDPTNWNVFDGVASDSYAVDVGSKGPFTACCSYLGYPIFFKEDNIYKMYGSYPAQFQVMASASLGVKKGASKSIAIAGEILFYLSRVGVMAYSGGIPQCVSSCLGTSMFWDGVAGSNGLKYFVSLKDVTQIPHIYVYDTQNKLWHKEDTVDVAGFAYAGGLFFASCSGTIYADGSNITVREDLTLRPEGEFPSFVEFADFTDDTPNRKGVSKLQLRIDIGDSGSVTVKIKLDGDYEGEWKVIQTLKAQKKRSYYLPIIPERADHFALRIEGTGDWKLHSLTIERYSGSEKF